jgi:hypothetical protein
MAPKIAGSLSPNCRALWRLLFTDTKSKDLTASGVQGQPQPLLMGFFADEAAEFVRFNLQGRDPEWFVALWGVYVKMRGRRRVALDSETPSATSCSHRPHGRCRSRESRSLSSRLTSARHSAETKALRKLSDNLAATSFASMVLFTVVEVTVLLVVPRAAPRSSVSYDHAQRIDLCGSRVLENLGLGGRGALHE